MQTEHRVKLYPCNRITIVKNYLFGGFIIHEAPGPSKPLAFEMTSAISDIKKLKDHYTHQKH